VVGEIKSNFNMQVESTTGQGFNFVEATIFDNTGMNELSAGMGDMSQNNIDYPAMIFDGPFSTALENVEVKGLSSKEISREQAKDYLINTVYSNRKDVEIGFLKETNGEISTFDFEIKVDGKDFDAQVSKMGGLLITISGYAENGDAIMGKEQAIELAKNFANNIGFENMDNVWFEEHNNVAYINLAPVEKGIIMYPDLVKVKVDLTSQEIIGFEALNYAYNHIDRSPEFNVSTADAEAVLGFDYNILKTSKAVIRLDSGIEKSCYEFIAERIDGVYFYYVDANTKEILKTLKLVTIENVQKLI
jgi:germination protein YpeB